MPSLKNSAAIFAERGAAEADSSGSSDSIQLMLGLIERGLDFVDHATDIAHSVGEGMLLKLFRGRPQRERSQIGRTAFNTMGGASEAFDILSGKAIFQLGNSLRGVLEEDRRDFPEELVIIVRIQRSEILDRFGFNDRKIGHGEGREPLGF